jgi:hypothetical protein
MVHYPKPRHSSDPCWRHYRSPIHENVCLRPRCRIHRPDQNRHDRRRWGRGVGSFRSRLGATSSHYFYTSANYGHRMVTHWEVSSLTTVSRAAQTIKRLSKPDIGRSMFLYLFSSSSQLLTLSHLPSSFLGSGVLCFKACDASEPNPLQLCQHIYDLVGCDYNSPADYTSINGTFTSCDGDLQTPAGQYVDNGVTMSWSQPPESLGPVTSVPYTPSIPASSNCITYQSSDLFTAVRD